MDNSNNNSHDLNRIDKIMPLVVQLHKMSKTPGKDSWSIEEIHDERYSNALYVQKETLEILQGDLEWLREQDAVDYQNGFRSIKLKESKLLEIINSHK
jgi:hypothetical protein